jgi:lipopolysaccharide transport system permease protein
MGVMIATMGVVFGKIFQSPLSQFLPYLTIGMIFWGFISLVLTEACQGFVIAQPIIKQLNIPLFVHIARLLWKNIIILAHNLIIFPLVLLVLAQPPTWLALLSIPGLIVLTFNLAWMALLLGIFCTRYRDMSPIINSLLQILFYLTPIMWMSEKLPARAGLYLINPNPFYHLLTIVRAPLLGQVPTLLNWTIAVSLGLCGWTVTLLIYSRHRHRIAYWL